VAQHITALELSNLVGWATHIDRPDQPIAIHVDSNNTLSSLSPPWFNPLLGLPGEDSLPPSLLHFIYKSGADSLRESSGQKRKWESFDTSAMVALGMVLEETITMALLPLARRYSERCMGLGSFADTDDTMHGRGQQRKAAAKRKKKKDKETKSAAAGAGSAADADSRVSSAELDAGESIEADDVTAGNEDQLFTDWTLPPEEALFKLLVRAPSNGSIDKGKSVSAKPGICHPEATSVGHYEPLTAKAFGKWCKDHDFEEGFVRDNMDVFGLFFPDELPPVGDEIEVSSTSTSSNTA